MSTSRETTLAALQAADRGWAVYPIRPHTKRPYFAHVRDLAVTITSPVEGDRRRAARTIVQWFDDVYREADLGAIPPAHIVRIDVDRHDPEKDGERRIARWQAAGFKLPLTLACTTPRGGTHHYLNARSTTGLTSYAICQDGSVELKVGQVILPPSHGYAWQGFGDEPIADLPRWVIDKWRNERQRRWREHGPAPTVDAAELVDRITVTTGNEPRMRGAFGSFRCPAHEDRNASAWLRTREPVIVGCSAGCAPAAILAALGLAGVSR